MRTVKLFHIKAIHKQCVTILGTGFLVFTSLFGPQLAPAQTATGTITGAVTDPAGLPIVDVNVAVRNADTGIESTYPTNSSGIYVATDWQPGNYQVTVARAGFRTVVEKDIAVHVGDRRRLHQDARAGGKQHGHGDRRSAAARNRRNPTPPRPSLGVRWKDYRSRPRRWENFVMLTPAVTTDGTSGLSSFRGISALYNGNSVDGANNTQAFFSEARGRAIIVSYVYSADSIREFEVSSSNYSAEYGQAAGGVVNAVTKSGTNQLHGDLFYNLRYPDLNALDPHSKAQGIDTQTVHQQNQFGGSIRPRSSKTNYSSSAPTTASARSIEFSTLRRRHLRRSIILPARPA